jgi:hypothetical protein
MSSKPSASRATCHCHHPHFTPEQALLGFVRNRASDAGMGTMIRLHDVANSG